jgi:hypothetical protein
MSIHEQLRRLIGRGGAKNKHKSEETVLAYTEEGRAQREAEILAFLSEEYRRRRDERQPLERQWTLNADFFAGRQRCAINPESGEIQPFSPLHSYEEQGVYNRIAPLIETRLASLRSLTFGMSVRPRTNEAEDCERSEIATSLLRYAQEAGHFTDKKDRLLLDCELYGTAFLLSTWRGEGEGGELTYSVVSPYSVFPASLYRAEVEEQPSILLAEVLPVDEIEAAYGVRVPGGDADVYRLTPTDGFQSYGTAGSTLAMQSGHAENCATLLTYFEKPSVREKNGRLMIAAGGQLLWYSDLPYDEIPLVAIKCKDGSGQFFGRSVITELIPLQRAYNGVKNKIHDYIRAVAANPLLVPEGAIADPDELATRGLPPGEIVEYNAERGRPEPLAPAPLPAELRRECEQLASDMEYVAGVSQLMMLGKTPAGVTSGTAIANLRQIDSTRLALTGENLRRAVRRLAGVWLRLYKRYTSGYGTMLIAGANAAAGVLCFCAEDINSYDVVFDAENELLVSPEAQRESFLTALNAGLLYDADGKLPRAVKSRARRLMQLGQAFDRTDLDELQLQAAERENAAAMSGDTLTVSLFDDHELHVEAHRRLLLQARFAYLKEKHPTRARALEMHILSHMAAMSPRTEEVRADEQTNG